MNDAFGFRDSTDETATTANGPRDFNPEPSRAAFVRHSRHRWQIPASPQYLRALREADLAVRRAAFRWVMLRQASRLARP